MSAHIRQAQRKQKGNILVPLLAVVAFAAVLAAGYFFWQNQNYLNTIDPDPRTVSPQPTNPNANLKIANWKTYISEKYGFSFKYPPEFNIVEKDLTFNNKVYPSLQILDPKSSLRLTADFKLEYGLTELGFKPSEYVIAVDNPKLIRNESGFKSQWTYFQKQNGGECYYGSGKIQDGDGGVECFNVNFPFNWSYELNSTDGTPFSTSKSQTEERFKLFDQILSTFKFL